jgi:rare lipoprotein A
MHVPVTSALTAPPLPPVEIVAGEAAAPLAPAVPAQTVLRVRRTKLNVLDGRAVTIAGALSADPRAGEARPVEEVARRIIVLQARRRHGWRTLASTPTGAHGRYRLRYLARRIGSELLRVSFAGGGSDRGAHRAVGRLNIYRLAEASWYGGGGSLACGGWLTRSTMGVANKTLPCGTLVTLRYGGRTVRVPVVDRGPYVAGREFDLTEATKRALGFEGVGEVWATS